MEEELLKKYVEFQNDPSCFLFFYFFYIIINNLSFKNPNGYG